MATADVQSGSRRRPVLLGVAAVSVLAVIAGAVVLRPSSTGDADKLVTADQGRPAPTFDVPDLHDERARITLAQFRGKPVVLNFWASWCAPCKNEMPFFQAVHDQLGDRVAFVGMNHQDGKSRAFDLLAETGVRYPSGYDPEGKVAAAYGAFGMPITVFISPEGRQLAVRHGEMTREELVTTIERLFGVGV